MQTTVLPKVAVVLVNWNGKDDTLECLASLAKIEYSNKEIIVVDNGSRDDSVAVIHAAFPHVTLLETGKNLGFTGGNNVGIERALSHNADYIFLLNNDTTIEPQALQELIAVASREKQFGLLTPVVYYYDDPDDVWFAGARLDLSRGEAVHDNSHPPQRTDDVRELPWASGCTMLFPAQVLRRLKGFDDRFFLNWEDVDLSLRVRRAGFKIGMVPSARVFHKVGKAFGHAVGTGASYYALRNNLLLVRLHGGRMRRRAALAIAVRQCRVVLEHLLRREKNTWYVVKVMLRAWKDHALGRYGPR